MTKTKAMFQQQFNLQNQDFTDSLTWWRLWLFLGWNDVAMQYKRSFLGPLWITLSTGIFIVSFGIVGAGIFGMNMKEYIPYFCIGHIVFGLFSSATNDSCQAYLSSESFLKQMRCPKLTFIFRVMVKDLIMFAHNFLIIFGVLIWAGKLSDVRWLDLLLGSTILIIAIWFAMSITAVIATRYRDVPMIVQSTLQIAFFITPVMWKIDQLNGTTRTVIELNPLTAFLEIVREPLLGMPICSEHVIEASILTICLGIATWTIYTFARRKIVYWL